MLVRDYIKRKLYDNSIGYFNYASGVIIDNENIEFTKLKNYKEYVQAINKLYDDDDSDSLFMTPTQIFTPYYSQVIANYLLSNHTNKTQKFTIYEFGAGLGVNANNILNYLKDYEEEIYNNCEYNIVEISNVLSDKQKMLLEKNHDSKLWNVHVKDVLEDDLTNIRTDEQVHIIGLEILDNLQHDKIFLNTKNFDVKNLTIDDQNIDKVFEGIVDEYGNENMRKINDPIIIQCMNLYCNNLNIYENRFMDSFWKNLKAFNFDPMVKNLARSQVLSKVIDNIKTVKYENDHYHQLFLPTGTLMLFNQIKKTFPNHFMLLSDFSFLPVPEKVQLSPALKCFNAPIVAGKNKIDYDSYINDKLCDIFFPTDFEKLDTMYRKSKTIPLNKETYIKTHEDFIASYGTDYMIDQCKTKSGYNGLVEDFVNVEYLLSSSKPDL